MGELCPLSGELVPESGGEVQNLVHVLRRRGNWFRSRVRMFPNRAKCDRCQGSGSRNRVMMFLNRVNRVRSRVSDVPESGESALSGELVPESGEEVPESVKCARRRGNWFRSRVRMF